MFNKDILYDVFWQKFMLYTLLIIEKWITNSLINKS